jgi:hypothetical protein
MKYSENNIKAVFAEKAPPLEPNVMKNFTRWYILLGSKGKAS